MNYKVTPFLSLFFVWLAHFFVDFMIGVWSIYKTIAHLDLAMAGMISGLAAFLGESMQIFFGPLSDRGYRKRLILFGLIITCSSAFLAYTTNYFWLLILFSLTCIGSGAFHPAAASLAGSLTQKQKAFFLTIFASGGSLGLAFSQILFTQTHQFFSGHTIFLVIPSLILMGAILFFGFSSPEVTTTKPKSQGADLKALFAFFKDRQLRLLYLAQVCSQTLLWATVFLLPDILQCRAYESWICLGGGHLFLVVGAAMMVIPSGYIADKYSPRKVLLWTFSGAMLTFYAFLYAQDLSTSVLLTLIFFIGAFLGCSNPILLAMGNKLRPQNPGMVSAFLLGLAWCVSEGLGQAGGGVLTKFFVDDAPAKALAVLGVFFILGLVAMWLFKEELTVKDDLEIDSLVKA